ncbi:MAG: hypothetical protein HRU01_11750 [Myxococcales bacterium]|nr:hypothetical protein [Myxococcales bacterium]
MKTRDAIILLVGVPGIAFAPMLVNGGVSWDSWLLFWDGIADSRDHLARWYWDSGKPQLYYLHAALLGLPDFVTWYRVLAFVSLLAWPVLFWLILRETRLLSEERSLHAALFAGTYPAFVVGHGLILLPYVLAVVLFLGGTLLLIRSSGSERARPGAVEVLSAFALFLFSFTISSLLAFYLAVWGAWVWIGASNRRRSVAAELFANRALYAAGLALPFLAYGFELLLFPARGWYQNYNVIAFSRDSVEAFASGLFWSFSAPFTRVASTLVEAPVASAIAAALLGGAVAAVAARGRRAAGDVASLPSRSVVLFAVCWLALAVVPYAAVGKLPKASAWDSRHALIVGFPIALLLAEGVAVLSRGVGRTAAAVLAGLLVAGFAQVQYRSQMAWLVRSAKDAAIVCSLSEQPPAEQSVYWIRDRTGLGPAERYRYYAWSSLLKSAWGDNTRLALTAGSTHERQIARARRKIRQGHRPMLRDVDFAGTHARIDVSAALEDTSNLGILRALAAGAARGPTDTCPRWPLVHVVVEPAEADVVRAWERLLRGTEDAAAQK